MLFWGFMIITIGSLELVVLGFVPGFEAFGFLGGEAQEMFLLTRHKFMRLLVCELMML